MIKCSLLPCISLFLVMHFEEWKIEFSILCCLLKLSLEVIEASWKLKGMARVKLRVQGRPRDPRWVHQYVMLSPSLPFLPFYCARSCSWNSCVENGIIHWKIHFFPHSLWISNTFSVYRRHGSRPIRNGFLMGSRVSPFFGLKTFGNSSTHCTFFWMADQTLISLNLLFYVISTNSSTSFRGNAMLLFGDAQIDR